MLTCFGRWGLMVKDETPTLYLPVPTPGMMLSNVADCHWVVNPSLPATALNRSTSKPITVLPSVSRNSLGAYVESVPMTSLPADLIWDGTFAASAASADAEGAEPPAEPVPVPPPDSEPQAAIDTVNAAATASPRTSRRGWKVQN